jgi:hypothetical protein
MGIIQINMLTIQINMVIRYFESLTAEIWRKKWRIRVFDAAGLPEAITVTLLLTQSRPSCVSIITTNLELLRKYDNFL